MSGSIGLGAFIGSSYVAARNLPARMYAIFTGLSSVLECSVPLRLRGITIRNAHPDQQGTTSGNPIFPPRAGPQDCDGTSRATTESDDQVKPSWRNGA